MTGVEEGGESRATASPLIPGPRKTALPFAEGGSCGSRHGGNRMVTVFDGVELAVPEKPLTGDVKEVNEHVDG